MGIVLKNNIVWGPKKAISEAFFEDISNIIKGSKEDYEILQLEIDEAIFYYTWTLDYRKKSLSEVLILLSVVEMLIQMFDEIYFNRLKEDIIKIYKNSILNLHSIIMDAVKYY
ncbi:hypothetical protein [Chryseobacterium lathyri]|uniref:Uncharacterized protein n=1 Tax=Chryseobacterium lathyri TaxID=395933 RepID=A0ABT9SLS5_9FLAO|nr:hypothetical protein [Chryseobacterium lathyri]MDP9960389.1 hypothetical protein [Chryseobacterium lathyri]